MSRYRGDEDLAPLPEGLEGLRGLALVKAAYAATRPAAATPRPRPRPFAVSKAPPPPEPLWTPHSAAQPSNPDEPRTHWADGTPFPDEEPPEEDR